MNRFSKSFATAISPIVERRGNIDISLVPSNQPIKIGTDLTRVISNQIEHFKKLGLGIIGRVMQQYLPSDNTKLLPLDPSYVKGIGIPLTQQTLVQIIINKAYGETFAERFDMAKAYLVIAQAESNFNPKPKGTHFGQLQFDKGTGVAAYAVGRKLINMDKLFLFTLTFMQRFHQSKAHNNQVLMNMGQLYNLKRVIASEWTLTSKGWKPKPNIANRPPAKAFVKTYPAILAHPQTGLIALLTAYHINGLYKFLLSKSATFSRPERIGKAVVQFYNLGRVPGLPKYIIDKLPANMGTLFTNATGDVEPNEESVTAVDTNSWWKAVVPFQFHQYPKGTGKLKSDWGDRPAFRDASTGKIIPPHFHYGQDWRGEMGQPVFALFDGQVTKSIDNGDRSYGQEMLLTDRVGGRVQRIGHLSRRFYEVTSPFTSVKKGEILGLVGTSGLSTAPHLHLEVLSWPDQVALAPNKWGVSGSNAVNAKGT